MLVWSNKRTVRGQTNNVVHYTASHNFIIDNYYSIWPFSHYETFSYPGLVVGLVIAQDYSRISLSIKSDI